MEELKLISTETLRDLIYEKFERMPDYPKTAEEEDPLAKVCVMWLIVSLQTWTFYQKQELNICPQGEFEVIKQLVGSTAGAGEAKRSRHRQVGFQHLIINLIP